MKRRCAALAILVLAVPAVPTSARLERPNPFFRSGGQHDKSMGF
ncbi:hypothetical protein LCGC14_2215070 [marine sediment metagenome]|uniref:Uncharacterized protein n=1 Tax=marine sediment metagenome TaxID=412755 RepID=A0A0F9G897_9ZZZZ